MTSQKNPKKILFFYFLKKILNSLQNVIRFMTFSLLWNVQNFIRRQSSTFWHLCAHRWGQAPGVPQTNFSECSYSKQPWKKEIQPLPLQRAYLLKQLLKLEIVSPFGVRHTYCPLWAQSFCSVQQSIKCAGVPWISSYSLVEIGIQ